MSLPEATLDFSTTVAIPEILLGTIMQQADIEGSPHLSFICLQHSCSPVFMDAVGTAQRMVGASKDTKRTSVRAA